MCSASGKSCGRCSPAWKRCRFGTTTGPATTFSILQRPGGTRLFLQHMVRVAGASLYDLTSRRDPARLSLSPRHPPRIYRSRSNLSLSASLASRHHRRRSQTPIASSATSSGQPFAKPVADGLRDSVSFGMAHNADAPVSISPAKPAPPATHLVSPGVTAGSPASPSSVAYRSLSAFISRRATAPMQPISRETSFSHEQNNRMMRLFIAHLALVTPRASAQQPSATTITLGLFSTMSFTVLPSRRSTQVDGSRPAPTCPRTALPAPLISGTSTTPSSSAGTSYATRRR